MAIFLLIEHASFDPSAFSEAALDFLSKNFSEVYSVEIQEVTVVVMRDEEHTGLNIKYLDHHYSTDILTFDLSESDGIVADICINGNVCLENASTYSVTKEEEMWRLICHGMLHLVGLDDQSSEQKKLMRKEEDRFLALLQENGFM